LFEGTELDQLPFSKQVRDLARANTRTDSSSRRDDPIEETR